jgi:capsular polysaccharide biosynthesis protein
MKNQVYDVEKTFLFAGRWWGNYYHFVIDYCIRYNDLKENGIIAEDTKLLFPGQIKSWQKEYFSLLGVNADDILLTNQKPLYVRNCLIAPTRRNRFLVSRSACKSFAHKMVNAAGQDAKVSSTKRLYISRKNNSRKILNEDELVLMLKSYNFKVVQCETLTVTEQIRLFSHAEVIVAAHGAGLANLIYAQSPKVIELIPNDAWVWGYFAMLTTHLGGNYHVVGGTCNTGNMDYKINIGELNLIIEAEVGLDMSDISACGSK